MNPFEMAVKEIAANVPGAVPGDYTGNDGLLYCGKCHTPKQYRVRILGRERAMPVMCSCRKEQHEAEQAAEQKRKREEIGMNLRRDCFADADEDTITAYFKNDDRRNENLSNAMKRYAEQWEDMKSKNIGLLLYGPVGTGKSFYAACIANELIDREKPVPVLMTSLARIINTVSGMYDGKQEYIDKIVRYPLLILDDIGTERSTEYALEQVYSVIDARYRTGRPLIVTTNTPIEKIKSPETLAQQRIYSRLLQMCQPVKVDGTDRRRDALKRDFAERQRLLGL